MAGEASITVVGNVGGDPEIRFTQSGKAVASFSIANTPRKKNAAGDWEDDETLWLRVNVWGWKGEAAAETIRKGNRVIVVGRLSPRTWETKEGEQRTSLEVTADEVAVIPKGQKRDDVYHADTRPTPTGDTTDRAPF